VERGQHEHAHLICVSTAKKIFYHAEHHKHVSRKYAHESRRIDALGELRLHTQQKYTDKKICLFFCTSIVHHFGAQKYFQDFCIAGKISCKNF
jgi:hypothetical protein